jgi:predicted nicotinamide N-methyase
LAAKRARLLARIKLRYRTLTESHAVGPLRLPFTRVADPNAVLDRVCVEEDRRERLSGQRRNGDELHLPYWAELWDSALGIGSYLAREWNRGVGTRASEDESGLARRSVLDLGCGMGFAGMVAAALGATVLFADLEADALLFAQLNSLAWNQRVRTRRLNWRIDRLDQRFDLIVGADVLYDRTQWDFLEPFFGAHLRAGGIILLAEPGRQTGDHFPEWISKRGWTVAERHEPLTTRARPLRVFQLARPASRKNKAQPEDCALGDGHPPRVPCESGSV